MGGAGTRRRALRGLCDTNVLVRHFTGDPPDMAAAATRFLASATELLVPDVVLAELVYVLESVYRVPREEVAELGRAIVGFPPVVMTDPEVALRALEVYERHRLDFADAYLVAVAEATGLRRIASFDRAIRRVPWVEVVTPE